jgi:putative metallohydrolase (TIGR04338 family)
MLALHGDHPLTLAQIQSYVLELRGEDWFRRRWPQPMRLHIADGRGDRHARCSSCDGQLFKLCFPRATRSEYFVLHELAHACTWHTARTDHDLIFMRALLVLVRRRMGRAAAKLLRQEWQAARLVA